jgi:hypothetical protein
MKNYKALLGSVFVSGAMFATTASTALAQTSGRSAALNRSKQNLGSFGQKSFGGSATPKSLPDIISSLIDYALGFLGILLVLYFLYGGFLWMTAGGDSGKVGKAQEIIKNASIGLALVIISFSIASFVLDALLSTAL